MIQPPEVLADKRRAALLSIVLNARLIGSEAGRWNMLAEHFMKQKLWQDIFLALFILTLTTIIISITRADLWLSSFFYRLGDWPIGELFPWKLLYRLDGYPALLMAIAGLCIAVYNCFAAGEHRWRRKSIFLILLLVLGPGLLVNAVFKENWGRPRPCEVIQFGGTREFLHPWQKGKIEQGHSFPSGHCSAAFYLTAPYYIYRYSKPVVAKRWLLTGLVFGILMSCARISQGGHFLSDTVWAWGMVHLTALVLASILLRRPSGSPRLTHCIK